MKFHLRLNLEPWTDLPGQQSRRTQLRFCSHNVSGSQPGACKSCVKPEMLHIHTCWPPRMLLAGSGGAGIQLQQWVYYQLLLLEHPPEDTWPDTPGH